MARAAFTRTAVGRMLDASSQPAYLLDDKRRIIYANPALADMLDVELDSLFRMRCDYHSEEGQGIGGSPAANAKTDAENPDDLEHSERLSQSGGSASLERSDPNSLVAFLCPPPEALNGTTTHSIIRAPSASRRERAVAWHVSHCPIFDADGGLQGVLSIFSHELPEVDNAGQPENTPSKLHDAIFRMRKRNCELFRVRGLVGGSASMGRVRDRIELLSSPEAIATRTLVCGPPGSGKEFVARTIHSRRIERGLRESNRGGSSADPPLPALVPIDCEIVDAEQLGANVTAFVQACAEVESQVTPTLLLLNVDRLEPAAQDELHAFLAIQELGLRTLGTSVLSRTELLAHDEYRNDLAENLASFEVELPAVRDRLDDVPLLVQYFLEKQNAKGGVQRSGFSTQALEQFVAYPWPGNVAEIEKVVTQCFANAKEITIGVDELPAQIRLGMDAVLYPAKTQEPIDLEQVLEDHERELISRTLEQTKQNKAEAARRLGMNRAKLLRRISHLGLD